MPEIKIDGAHYRAVRVPEEPHLREMEISDCTFYGGRVSLDVGQQAPEIRGCSFGKPEDEL